MCALSLVHSFILARTDAVSTVYFRTTTTRVSILGFSPSQRPSLPTLLFSLCINIAYLVTITASSLAIPFHTNLVHQANYLDVCVDGPPVYR